MASAFDYRVFGLHVRSDIMLPELPDANPQSAPDVLIRIGRVPQGGFAPGGPYATNDGLLLVISDVGRYFVKAGTEIIVEPNAGAPEANVRLFLLGSAMGALLHQRGLLPLHANAIEIDGRAVAFTGKSGAGKSTLAAWFHDRGHRIIADDVCVIRFDPAGRAFASPGLPRLRLWKEALEASGRQSSAYNLSYAGKDSFEKYDVPIASQSIAAAEVEVAAIYLLGTGEALSIAQLYGVEAAEAVLANTYRGGYVSMANTMREYWSSCVNLVRSTPVFAVERQWGLDILDEQCTKILGHVRQLAERTQAKTAS